MNTATTVLANNQTQVSNKLWARNISDEVVSFTMTPRDGSGREIAVIVPKTWIPIDLSEHATRADLESSPMFSRCVNRKLLELVPEAEAARIMAREDAREEYNRIFNPYNGGVKPVDDGTPVAKVEDSSASNEDVLLSTIGSALDDTASVNQFKVMANRSKMTHSLAKRTTLLADELGRPKLRAAAEEWMNEGR